MKWDDLARQLTDVPNGSGRCVYAALHSVDDGSCLGRYPKDGQPVHAPFYSSDMKYWHYWLLNTCSMHLEFEVCPNSDPVTEVCRNLDRGKTALLSESERDNAAEESISGSYDAVFIGNHPQRHAFHLRQGGEKRFARPDDQLRLSRNANRQRYFID
ncbi:hypothetical protein CEXT_684901 [Caerostris extrusa]|uniref:Uncharacterized protein n=1 Tax=Caerostris extrusa TaxID=172846 RepID=A0AAV4NXX8_CAEEX|nr:hypothetical protein CEXT_684901 [Caerostris extrusa]